MRIISTVISTIGLITFISCGQSAEEKAAREKAVADSIAVVQKMKIDSVAKATEEATKHKIEMKLAIQDSIKNTTADMEIVKMQLANAKGDLEAASDQMGTIKQWQFGRSQDEREVQIKNQTMLIDNLENNIKDLQTSILTAEEKIKNFEADVKKYE